MEATDHAFPVSSNFGPEEKEVVYGMTLLHYFMAHAPKVPNKTWYKPVLLEKPKKLTSMEWKFGKNSDHPQKELVMKFWNDDAELWDSSPEVPEELKQEVSDYCKQLAENYEAIRAWEALEQKEFYLQWPRAWAEEMIRRAEEIPTEYGVKPATPEQGNKPQSWFDTDHLENKPETHEHWCNFMDIHYHKEPYGHYLTAAVSQAWQDGFEYHAKINKP